MTVSHLGVKQRFHLHVYRLDIFDERERLVKIVNLPPIEPIGDADLQLLCVLQDVDLRDGDFLHTVEASRVLQGHKVEPPHPPRSTRGGSVLAPDLSNLLAEAPPDLGGEGARPDPGRVTLQDSQDIGVCRDAEACGRVICDRGSAGYVRVGTVEDVEKCPLRAFEDHRLLVLVEFGDPRSDVTQLLLQDFPRKGQPVVEARRRFFQKAMKGPGRIEVEVVRKDVDCPGSEAERSHSVCGPDSSPCRAEGACTPHLLDHHIHDLLEGGHEWAPSVHTEVCVSSSPLQKGELLREDYRVDGNSRTYQQLLSLRSSRGQEVKDVPLSADDYCVTRVAPSVEAGDRLEVVRDVVDYLALSLVSPLEADYRGVFLLLRPRQLSQCRAGGSP